MPWFYIDGERSFPFSSPLIYISSSLVKDFKHREKSIWNSISTLDIGSSSSNIMNRKTNSSSRFGNKSCLLESWINSFNWIVLHCQQKARTHLRLWSTCIEKSGSSMSKPFFANHVISVNHRADITFVNTHCNSHYHMLRSFYDFSMNFKQIWFFESFVTKIIIVPISFIYDSFI